jgi:two-component system chemotaxis response regulator CheB
MAGHPVVVIGASAGGLQALTTIVERLPPTLRACVVVVVHSSSNGEGVLPQILGRVGALPVAFAESGDPITPGRIYVARPDCHVLIVGQRLLLSHGPRENGFRPAIDPLFRTAARQLGSWAIGVILSGALSDGTYGLSTIKQHGGATIVQDPDDALIPTMPQSAIRSVPVDSVLRADAIAAEIVRLAEHLAEERGRRERPRTRALEPQQPSDDTEVADMQERFGEPSALTCPDCGGALWQVEEGRVVRYQCHVGHQYAPENLEAAQRDAVDDALWTAVRVLEEHTALKLRMAKRAADSGLEMVSAGFREGAQEAHTQAQRIRSILFRPGNGSGAESADAARAHIKQNAKRVAARSRKRRAGSKRARKA